MWQSVQTGAVSRFSRPHFEHVAMATSASIAPVSGEKVFEQVNAAGEGNQQQVDDEIRPALNALMKCVGFRLIRRDHGAEKFHEVHAAFIACSAVPLLVGAGRAGVAERHVATRAESRHVACVRTAFRALDHQPCGRGAEIERTRAGGRCISRCCRRPLRGYRRTTIARLRTIPSRSRIVGRRGSHIPHSSGSCGAFLRWQSASATSSLPCPPVQAGFGGARSRRNARHRAMRYLPL